MPQPAHQESNDFEFDNGGDEDGNKVDAENTVTLNMKVRNQISLWITLMLPINLNLTLFMLRHTYLVVGLEFHRFRSYIAHIDKDLQRKKYFTTKTWQS